MPYSGLKKLDWTPNWTTSWNAFSLQTWLMKFKVVDTTITELWRKDITPMVKSSIEDTSPYAIKPLSEERSFAVQIMFSSNFLTTTESL